MQNNFIKILDIKISTLSKVEILDFIKNNLIQKNKIFISTPNPEFILEANKNNDFKDILNNNTDLNIPDGVGLIYASKFLNTAPLIKERVAGSDLTIEIVKIAKELGRKVFLLGGNSIEQLEIVKTKLGSDIVSGYDVGFTKEEFASNIHESEKNDSLLQKINNSKAEILLVAFGAPKQEYWISKNLDKLNSVYLSIGVGGTFDFISEYKKRAPLWMQKLSIEWLFRLIQEPTRTKRIINAVVIFPLKVVGSKLFK